MIVQIILITQAVLNTLLGVTAPQVIPTSKYSTADTGATSASNTDLEVQYSRYRSNVCFKLLALFEFSRISINQKAFAC